MATILAAKDDPAAALTWTERGLGIETSYDLRAKHRELLTVLDRHDEAIQNEWSHFTQAPTIYSYQTLVELVPETARDLARQGDRGGRSVGRLAIGAARAPGRYGGDRASWLRHRPVHRRPRESRGLPHR
jgi:hypothetical protein